MADVGEIFYRNGALIKSLPRNPPQRIDFSCSGECFFAKKLPAGARTPEPMCNKLPITTSLGFRDFRNVPDVPRNFARLAIRRSRLSRKTRGVVSSSTDDFINTPFLLAKTAANRRTGLYRPIPSAVSNHAASASFFFAAPRKASSGRNCSSPPANVTAAAGGRSH